MIAPLSSTREKMMDVDALANEIRRLDGDHLNRLGAGALAEALMPFLRRSPSPDVAVEATDELVEKVAKAIDSVQLFSRVNKYLIPPKIEICRYGGYCEPEIVVLKSIGVNEDERDALADEVREQRARAAIASLSSSNVMEQNAIIEECAKCVPTNWLDDLLTGPGTIDLPWSAPTIERLLVSIKCRIRALSASPASPSPDIGGK